MICIYFLSATWLFKIYTICETHVKIGAKFQFQVLLTREQKVKGQSFIPTLYTYRLPKLRQNQLHPRLPTLAYSRIVFQNTTTKILCTQPQL